MYFACFARAILITLGQEYIKQLLSSLQTFPEGILPCGKTTEGFLANLPVTRGSIDARAYLYFVNGSARPPSSDYRNRACEPYQINVRISGASLKLALGRRPYLFPALWVVLIWLMTDTRLLISSCINQFSLTFLLRRHYSSNTYKVPGGIVLAFPSSRILSTPFVVEFFLLWPQSARYDVVPVYRLTAMHLNRIPTPVVECRFTLRRWPLCWMLTPLVRIIWTHVYYKSGW